MAWSDTKTESKKDFVPCPTGPHMATCIDIVDMGIPAWSKTEKKPEGEHKVKIVFHAEVLDAFGNPMSNPSGKAWVVEQMFTMYFGPKSFLRKFVEGWVGVLSPEQAADFDEESLIGKNAYITVIHNAKGYANVQSAAKPLPGMKGPGPIPDYVRHRDRKFGKQTKDGDLPF